MKYIDLHCDTILNCMKDIPLRNNECHIDIERLKKSGYVLQCFAMFVNLKKYDNPFERVNEMIDKYYEKIEKNKDLITPVYSYDQLINNIENDKLSSLLTIEEGAVINGNLSFLRNLYRLGVRMITLTWNFENGIGYPNFSITMDEKPDMKTPNTTLGLTNLGIQMIKEMERLGIIIDVSHLSDKGFYDVLENTTKPFIASHSNARSVCNNVRNLTDDMIKKLDKRGGVMGMNYCTSFVSSDEKITYVKDIVKHIKYIKEIASINVIALGSDFDGIESTLEMNGCDKINMIIEEMREEGFTEEEIEKVCYKNALRVFKEILI